MTNTSDHFRILQTPLELPCGAVIKSRIAKSPMSDSLSDGGGNPTEEQIRLRDALEVVRLLDQPPLTLLILAVGHTFREQRQARRLQAQVHTFLILPDAQKRSPRYL